MTLAENERVFQTAGRNALRGTEEKVRNVEREEQFKRFLEQLEKERIAKEDIVRVKAEVRVVLARFFDRQMWVQNSARRCRLFRVFEIIREKRCVELPLFSTFSQKFQTSTRKENIFN